MPLINCPDCGRKVSDQATICPDCGRPIAGNNASLDSLSVGDETPIELTSKRFKLISAFSIAAIILGIILIASAPPDSETGEASSLGIFGILFLFAGILSYIVNRARIWWHHK